MEDPHGCERGPVHPTGARRDSPTMVQPAAEHASRPRIAPVRPLPPGRGHRSVSLSVEGGQRRLQQADGPFLTFPGSPSPSKVRRRQGGSPLTTGRVCRKNRSDASSLLPRKLSKNPGTWEGRVTQARRQPPLGRRGGEKTGCAPPRCSSQQLRQVLRAPRRGVGGKTARHKVLESQAMTSS